MSSEIDPKRREVLMGAPVAFLATATAAAPALASFQDPIVAWLEEWRRARSEYEDAPLTDSEEQDQERYRAMRRHVDRITSATPRTPEGVAAQLEVMMGDVMVDDCTGGLVPKMMERIIGSLRSGLTTSGAFAGV